MVLRPGFASLAFVVAACGSSPHGTVDGGGGGGGGIDAASDAPADGTPDGGGAGCAGLAYCDDFESYSGAITDGMTLGPWKAAVSAVTMTVDDVHPYGTGKSLHIVIPAGNASTTGGTPTHGTLTQKNALGLVGNNDLFGRAMVYYSNSGTNGLPIGVHSWLFIASGTATAISGTASLNMGGGGAKMQLNYSPGDVSVQGGMMTAGMWHCVQWEYNGAGSPPADTAMVWVDGTPAITIPASKGWNMATPWSSMSFGFTHFQTTTNPVELFLDDFAVDGAMIPCP